MEPLGLLMYPFSSVECPPLFNHSIFFLLASHIDLNIRFPVVIIQPMMLCSCSLGFYIGLICKLPNLKYTTCLHFDIYALKNLKSSPCSNHTREFWTYIFIQLLNMPIFRFHRHFKITNSKLFVSTPLPPVFSPLVNRKSHLQFK